ncbi:MAG: 4Fe-4S binding protein [Bacteroidales bacterium]|nr:4Fe-4S binding protein [Bacteroidales bacterium]
MKRKIVEIDEELCNGCGECIPNCQEGALQIIDSKARLISDLFCDGLGACIGHCPEGAITIVEREAEPYNERKVMELIIPKGRNTILAHLKHLRDHNEVDFLNVAIQYLKENDIDMSNEGFELKKPAKAGYPDQVINTDPEQPAQACGCMGSQAMDFNIDHEEVNEAPTAGSDNVNIPSELKQWPVQLHLLNPQASYFRDADVVLTADCVPFAMANFHSRFLKGKSLAIACPKLDTNKESYIQKLASMIADSRINSLSVIMMEVPCCGGLLAMAETARQKAGRNVPIKRIIVGIKGDVLEEDWA